MKDKRDALENSIYNDDKKGIINILKTVKTNEEKLLILNSIDYDNTTPLILAARELKSLPIVKLLIEYGSLINTGERFDSVADGTALHIACKYELTDMFKYLLDHVVKNKTFDDINVRDGNNSNVLIVIADEDDINLLRILLSSQCKNYIDYKAKNKNGETALYIASRFHNFEMAEMLFNASDDTKKVVNVRSVSKWTPLHIAVRRDDDRLIKLLIANGAKVNVRDYKDDTPLIRACFYNHPKPVIALLKNGANVTIKNIDGETALDVAIKRKNNSVIELLRN